jgi:DNA-binding PadR family transcriptional regulator
MAWMDYMKVRSSTVYENKGLAKSLLMTIAMLIERAEENDEQTENEGWCFASERYLAESLGMSESQAAKWIKVFERDSWIVIERGQNERGHHRNRYRFSDNTVARLDKLKRERGAERVKNPKKVRHDKNPLLRARSDEEISSGVLRGENSLPAGSGEDTPLGAGGPYRSEPSRLAAPSVQSSGGSGFCEKYGETVIQTDGGPSASQREKNPTPKPDAVGMQGTCVPLQPRADRNTPGETPVPPKTVHRHSWIDGKCFGCGQECEHLNVNREGYCRVCEADTWKTCSACRRRSDEVWKDGVCSICHYKSSLAREAAVQ